MKASTLEKDKNPPEDVEGNQQIKLHESPSVINNYLTHNNKVNQNAQNTPKPEELLDLKTHEACKLPENETPQPLDKDNKNLRKNNEALWDYAEMGESQKLLDLLTREKAIDLNSTLLDDWTALHLAANEGHKEVVKILIDHGANIEAETRMNRRALHIACLRGNLEVVKILINAKAELNAKDKDSYTPLHFTSENGSNEIIRLLLENGASPNVKNYQGNTPCDLCLNVETRKIFDECKCTVENDYGRTFLGDAILNNSRADHINRFLILKEKNKASMINSAIEGTKNEGEEEKNANAAAKSPKKHEDNKPLENVMKVSKITIHDTETKEDSKTFAIEKIGPQSFEYYKLLGKGSFGEVYLVKKKGNPRFYAMKVLQKDRIINQNLVRYAKTERNILSIMNHPFIVKLNFAFQNEKRLFLVMDFCPGGDLGKLLNKTKKFDEEVAKIYICEVLLALEALHKNMIVFRDLKPDNVVLDEDGHALLTDFGLSKQGVQDSSRSFCGSVAYLAPEMLNRTGHNRTVDWYLLGVLLYEFLVGIPPYYSNNRDQLFDNIKKGPLMLPKHNMSEDAKSLIKGLLCRNPSARLGAKNDGEEIRQHPFFKGINWNDVMNRKLKPPPIEKKEITNAPLVLKLNDQADPIEVARNHIQGWSFFGDDDLNVISKKEGEI